jgi:hypothetical protein
VERSSGDTFGSGLVDSLQPDCVYGTTTTAVRGGTQKNGHKFFIHSHFKAIRPLPRINSYRSPFCRAITRFIRLAPELHSSMASNKCPERRDHPISLSLSAGHSMTFPSPFFAYAPSFYSASHHVKPIESAMRKHTKAVSTTGALVVRVLCLVCVEIDFI